MKRSFEVESCDVGRFNRSGSVQLKMPVGPSFDQHMKHHKLRRLGTVCLDWRHYSISILPRAMFSQHEFLELRVLQLSGNFLLDQRWNGEVLCQTLTKLIILELDGCCLNELPHNMGNLHELEYLIASRNYLQKLPKSISQCSKLESLILDDNWFESLPRWVGSTLTQLSVLNLRRNPLASLPTSITSLKKLTLLNVMKTKLPLNGLVRCFYIRKIN